MGNQRSQFEQRFSNNYAFIEALQDPIHGFVKIYRKKFENYHYVMVIDRRLEQFNNRTFMTDCIKPRSLQKNTSSTFAPKLLVKQREDSLIEYNSIKLQKLKRTLQLVKRYQDDLMVPFFSYQVVNGSKLQCTEPVIQLYVQFQNHRLFEYLQVLRCKQLPLKAKEIIYILKSVCQGISQFEKMQIQVTAKEINVHNIYTSNEGEIKLHPIEILTKKEHQRQNIQNIESLKEQCSKNPHIEMKKIALGKSLRSSSSAGDKKSSDEKNSNLGTNYLRERNILFSSNESSMGHVGKLMNHKEILKKLLIDLSAYSLLKNSENKDLQVLNMIINKGSSVGEIGASLQKYGSPCIEGLLVERIYDLDQNINKGADGHNANKQGLSTSGLSNGQLSSTSDVNRHQPVVNGQQYKRLSAKNQTNKGAVDKFQGINSVTNYNVVLTNSNYNSSIQNQKGKGGTSTYNEYSEQKANIVRGVQMEKRHELSQNNYQNIAKISQYSHVPHHTFTISPNQYSIDRINNLINHPGIPTYSNLEMMGRNVHVDRMQNKGYRKDQSRQR